MDLLQINSLWKEAVGPLERGFQVLTPEWKMLKRLKNFTQLSLREIRFPVELRFGGGVAMSVDGGPTARATSNEPVEAVVTWNHMTKRFEISYDVMLAQNDEKFQRQEVAKQLKYQTMDSLKSMQKAMSIQFYGKPDGVVAEINSAAGTPTFTIKNRYGITGLTADASWFTAGKDKIAILDPADSSVRGVRLVTAVNRATPSITLASVVTNAATDDWIVFANQIDGVSTDHNRALTGLIELITATTVHGINSSTAGNEDWTAGENVALSGALTGARMFTLFSEIEQASGYRPNVALSTIGVLANAGGAELDQRRYTSDDDTMRIGFRHVNVMGVDVAAESPFVPPGYFFAFSTDALKKLSPDDDPEKVKTGGPSEFVYGGTYLGYFCDHVFRIELVTTNRKALGLLTAVTES